MRRALIIASIPESSEFERTVCLSPTKPRFVADHSSMEEKASERGDRYVNSGKIATAKHPHHFPARLGHTVALSDRLNSDYSNPPPVPPRLCKPPSKVTRQGNTQVMRTTISPLPPNPVSKVTRPQSHGGEADIISTTPRTESRQSRYRSTPVFEDWKLPSDLQTRSKLPASTQPASKVEQLREPDDDDQSKKAMSLNQFSLQYSHMLPMRVKIVKGCGPLLQNGKVYNIHFVKRLKV